MSRGTQDNWEKLVGAVLDREELRRIAYCESLSSSVSAASGISGITLSSAADSSHHGAQLLRFNEIEKATKKFHHNMRLGEGAFGPVFKGWIDEHTLCASRRRNGIAVAVKKWVSGSRQVHQEYLNEIMYLSQLHHPNLVTLIGYCSEEDCLLLVYEFMPKGSLDNLLFGGGKRSLSWATRIKVAIAAASALSFLHELHRPVIHRGCQCSNILLDGVSLAKYLTSFYSSVSITDSLHRDIQTPFPAMRLQLWWQEFNAKLSGFGMARDGPTGVATQVAGVYGVVAPEYALTGQFTEKSDVFSFGAILLELLSGRRALDLKQPLEEQYLVEWARQYLGDKTKMLQIMDTRLRGQYPHNEAYAVANLACQCLRTEPDERPRMAEVVIVLQQLECP